MFFDNSKYFIFNKNIDLPNHGKIQIYKLDCNLLDEDSFNSWALSFRNNYVEKDSLPLLISGTNLNQEDYLIKFIFPNPNNRLGAGTLSGEFGEILVYDYVNFILKYYVTRTRYLEKVNPNSSVTGSDVIGYKMEQSKKSSPSDKLFIGEVKTSSSVSGNKNNLCKKRVENAIKDSEKDLVRFAESLNAEKRRLIDRKKFDEAKIVERFQNKTDNPFILELFAVLVLDEELYIEDTILNVVNSHVEPNKTINVLVIYSQKLKEFLIELYRRACVC